MCRAPQPGDSGPPRTPAWVGRTQINPVRKKERNICFFEHPEAPCSRFAVQAGGGETPAFFCTKCTHPERADRQVFYPVSACAGACLAHRCHLHISPPRAARRRVRAIIEASSGRADVGRRGNYRTTYRRALSWESSRQGWSAAAEVHDELHNVCRAAATRHAPPNGPAELHFLVSASLRRHITGGRIRSFEPRCVRISDMHTLNCYDDVVSLPSRQRRRSGTNARGGTAPGWLQIPQASTAMWRGRASWDRPPRSLRPHFQRDNVGHMYVQSSPRAGSHRTDDLRPSTTYVESSDDLRCGPSTPASRTSPALSPSRLAPRVCCVFATTTVHGSRRAPTSKSLQI